MPHATPAAPVNNYARVPVEVLDYTIDFLHDDPVTLKAVALASRELLNSSRYHQFRTVTLQSVEQFYAFKRLLDSDAAIAAFVQELHIRPMGNYHSTDQRVWLPLVPHELADRLRKLKRLHLDRVQWTRYPYTESLTPYLSRFSGVQDLCLTACAFTSFADLEAVVLSFSKISRLSLLMTYWSNPAETMPHLDQRNADRERIKLSYLRVGRGCDLAAMYQWVGRTATLRQHTLWTLELDMISSHEDTKAAGELLRRLGPHLNQLTIGCNFSYGTQMLSFFNDYIDVAANTGLRQLRLRVADVSPWSMVWIPRLLTQIMHAPLAKVLLSVSLFTDWQMRAPEWGEVAELLAVRRVRELVVVNHSDWFDSDIRASIEDTFAVFGQRSALQVVHRPVQLERSRARGRGGVLTS